MEIGNIDFCPCGSGKKYKKCCLFKEQASLASLGSYRLGKMRDEVSVQLLEFAKKIYGDLCIIEAWDDFWLEDIPDDFQFDSPFQQLFLPWFLFQWIPERPIEKPEDNSLFPSPYTIVARYLVKRSQKMDPNTRKYLEASRREPLSFWQVQEVQEGSGMLLEDLIVNREHFVRDVAGSRVFKKWDILFGQIVGVGGDFIINGCGPFPLPAAFKQYIAPEIKRIARQRKKKSSPVTLLEYDVDFIVLYQYCIQELLSPSLPELKNAEGEELIWSKSTYSITPKKTYEVIEILKSMKEMELQESPFEKGGWNFSWLLAGASSDVVGGVLMGTMVVEKNVLKTKCNSRDRDKNLRKMLARKMGNLIRYTNTVFEKFDVEEAAARNILAVREQAMESYSETGKESFTKTMVTRYMRWVDQKVPALGGKTPREAVRTEIGKQRVAELINEWENLELRASKVQFHFDFNDLRIVLGLSKE